MSISTGAPSINPTLDSGDSAQTLLGITVVSVIVYTIVGPAIAMVITGNSLAELKKGDAAEMSPGLMVAQSAICPLLGLIALIACNLIARNQPLQKLGLTRAKLLRALIRQGPLAIIAILPCMFFMTWLTERFWILIHYQHPMEHDLLRIFSEQFSTPIRAGIVVSAILLAPPAEEFFFRGMLQTAAKRLMDPAGRNPWIVRILAIVFTSILFALVHIQLWMMPPLFFLAICLGLAYELTTNLWVPMIVHASFNAISLTWFVATLKR